MLVFSHIPQTSDPRFDCYLQYVRGVRRFPQSLRKYEKYLSKSSEIPSKIGPGASKNTFKKRSLKITLIFTEFGVLKLQIEARTLPKWSLKTPPATLRAHRKRHPFFIQILSVFGAPWADLSAPIPRPTAYPHISKYIYTRIYTRRTDGG